MRRKIRRFLLCGKKTLSTREEESEGKESGCTNEKICQPEAAMSLQWRSETMISLQRKAAITTDENAKDLKDLLKDSMRREKLNEFSIL